MNANYMKQITYKEESYAIVGVCLKFTNLKFQYEHFAKTQHIKTKNNSSDVLL
jgi:hypothetical protein